MVLEQNILWNWFFLRSQTYFLQLKIEIFKTAKLKKIQEILNTFIKSFLWNFSASPPLQFTLYFNSSTPPSKFHQISKPQKINNFS